MNVADALRSRYTCRSFQPNALSRDTLLAILDAANHTPSWANTQPWQIFAATGDVLEGLRREYLASFQRGEETNPDLPRPPQWPPAFEARMHELGAKRFASLGIDRIDDDARRALSELGYRFFNAPAVVYLCMESTLSSWSIFDLGMIAQSIMLAAEEQGVATAIAYNLVTYPDLVRQHVGIPADLSVIIGIAMGYADLEHPQNRFRSERRPLDEVVTIKGL